MAFDERPLLVLALGGNALSPTDDKNTDGYDSERSLVAKSARETAKLIARGYRLLVVHGNGPQVGRLMDRESGFNNLDIHVAQTQGELGYLLMGAMDDSFACILTRVVVPENPGPPVKAIGPLLARRPPHAIPCVRVNRGWRMLVPSPKPTKILESEVIATLCRTHHVIAGGGGGIPITRDGRPVPAVIDKDWVAGQLAIELDAKMLLFATNVDYVYSRFGEPDAKPLRRVTIQQGYALIESGTAGPGSMAPKIGAALNFAESTQRPAHVCSLGEIEAAIDGQAGSAIG
jgi:carbamate kinase